MLRDAAAFELAAATLAAGVSSNWSMSKVSSIVKSALLSC